MTLSLEEEELLSLKVQLYPVLFDKTYQGYKGKNIVLNAWEKVAESLEFTENGKRAQTLFNILRKRYLRKRRELEDVNKYGASNVSVLRAEKALKQYDFMRWLDPFIQLRTRRTNFPTKNMNTLEESAFTESIKDGDDGLTTDQYLNEEKFNKEKDDTLSTKTNTTETQGNSRVKESIKREIKGAAKDNEMEISFRMNERINRREKRKAEKEEENESEDIFCKALAIDLMKLPYYQRCIANMSCEVFCLNIKWPQ